MTLNTEEPFFEKIETSLINVNRGVQEDNSAIGHMGSARKMVD